MMGQRSVALAVVLALAAGSASAQEIGFGGSVSAVSDYMSSGESQTLGRPALQFTGFGYVPQGFYAGLFLSSIDYGDADSLEVGLFIGWEHQFANGVSLDLGYEHYFYNDSGWCCGFIHAEASTFVTEQLEIGGRATWRTDNSATNIRAMLAYYPTDQIGLRAMIGRNSSSALNFAPDPPFGPRSVTYGNVGLDYFFTDTLTASIDYHRSNSVWDKSSVVFGLTQSF